MISIPATFELPFSPEMSLPHQHEVLSVSPPKKRKVGRLVGSKNKQKLEGVRPWKLGMAKSGPKKAKRSFCTRRVLYLTKVEGSGMQLVVEEIVSTDGSLPHEEASNE